MYCPYINGECYQENINCLNCSNYQVYWQRILFPAQYFNYECPDCHGKFNQPAIPTVTSSIYYKCPFCGRAMEGLK